MQFRQLRYFVKIVEAGSFSRAAALIHVAQPALSQQIHEFEERLGVTLLPSGRRELINRAFAERGLLPNVVAEADTLAVRSGVASTILPIAD